LRYGENRLRYDKSHAGIGKYLQEFPGGTVLLGNSNQKFKEWGIFIQGCPAISPIFSQSFSSPVIFPKSDGRGLFRKILKTKRGQTAEFKEKKKSQAGFHRVSTFCYLKDLVTF